MKTLANLYSVSDIARLFGLHESRIRYWAQTGFINPSGAHDGRRHYTFLDLIKIKAAKELLDQGIPLQRVRKNLQALREAMPQLEQPLTQLRICSDGEQLVVNQKEGTFEPLTGQMLLDFEVSELHRQIAQLIELKADGPAPFPLLSSGTITTTVDQTAEASTADPAPLDSTTAYEWFLRGCALDTEETRMAEAMAAYEKAFELDPGLAPACTNMGNLHYRQGNIEAALLNYQQACSLDPDQPEAHYNLANLFEEQGELEMAIAEHRRALALNPHFIDAHFNLALTLEKVGSRRQAQQHWQHFLELAANAANALEEEWLEIARFHLQVLDRRADPATSSPRNGISR